MNAPNCDLLQDQLPEFALGLLDGEQRARVVDHITICDACRKDAARLSAAADSLTAAAPVEEPPAGFEGRVLARLAAAQAEAPAASAAAPVAPVLSLDRQRRRSRRILLGIAAAILLVAAAAAGSAVVVDRHNASVTAALTRTVPMHTASGKDVGDLTISGSPVAVLIAAPAWSKTGHDTYGMRIQLRSGRVIDYGDITLDDGYGGYGLKGVEVGDIQQIDMVLSTGKVVCTAVF